MNIIKELQKEYFYIKEVAELTGVSEQLIRKWEKRYQIIQPKRLANGYRIYTQENLLILKELKALRSQGITMQQAIQGVLDKRQEETSAYKFNKVAKSSYVEKMIQCGENYDEDQLLFFLKKANYKFGLDIFLQNTIQPFLEEIGDLWESEEWDESQETISSLVVRDYLTGISRNFNNHSNAPYALGFCLPDELHEIPLQIMLLQLKIRGWRTTMIGASPKFTAIETLIARLQPDAVLFSATSIIPFQQNDKLLLKLDEIAATYPEIHFFIGGAGVWDFTKIVKPKYMTISYTVDDVVNRKQLDN